MNFTGKNIFNDPIFFHIIPVYPPEKSEKHGHEVKELVVSGRLRDVHFGFKIFVRGQTLRNRHNKSTVQI